MIVYSATHPESLIEEQVAKLSASSANTCCFAVSYDFQQYYLPGQPSISLLGLVAVTHHPDMSYFSLAVMQYSENLVKQLAELPADSISMQSFAAAQHSPWFDLSTPLLLEPVNIPKPWGQEIWFTGIEARGQSMVRAQGFYTYLPWLLSLMPSRLLAQDPQRLILLKILDPLPDDVYGDLYFEMHQHKQEVYVVTHVDSTAWPDNVGGIRLGFDEEKQAEFTEAAEFKQAYLRAVKEYEAVRREIDREFDVLRAKNRIGLNDPVAAHTLKMWHNTLAPELVVQEQQKREAMHAFTALLPMRVGDVVCVPRFIPHALQHGVRTVEFQTPVYERQILSFTQKVLTQTHWDTEAALQVLQLKTPKQPPFKQLFVNDVVTVEQVVEFNDFYVQRIRLRAGASFSLTNISSFNAKQSYSLLMVISGVVTAMNEHGENVNSFVPAQAMLLPASWRHCEWVAGEDESILLLASPVVDK